VKKNGKKLDDDVLLNTTKLMFYLSQKGKNYNRFGTKNLYWKNFDVVNGIERLFLIFEFLSTQPNQSDEEKEIVKGIAFSLCFLFQSEKPPPSYKPLLVYFKNNSISYYDYYSDIEYGFLVKYKFNTLNKIIRNN
jgi:hypothetical protein